MGCTFNTNKLNERRNSVNKKLSVYFIPLNIFYFSRIEYSKFPEVAEYKIDYFLPERNLVTFDEMISLLESSEFIPEDVRGFDPIIGFAYKNRMIIIDPIQNIAYNGSKYFNIPENLFIEIRDLLPFFLIEDFIEGLEHSRGDNTIDPNMIIEKGLPKYEDLFKDLEHSNNNIIDPNTIIK